MLTLAIVVGVKIPSVADQVAVVVVLELGGFSVLLDVCESRSAQRVRDAYLAHDQFFAALEARLTSHDRLAGGAFSLADAALLPYVLRVDHLALDGLFEERSGLSAWYQRVQDRPAYEVAVSAWLPDAVVANFRAAGGAVADDVREVLAAP